MAYPQELIDREFEGRIFRIRGDQGNPLQASTIKEALWEIWVRTERDRDRHIQLGEIRDRRAGELKSSDTAGRYWQMACRWPMTP
jgi:hypothetical protein